MRILCALTLAITSFAVSAHAQERLPAEVAGTWRIARILNIQGSTCWTRAQAEPLVGSTLRYTPTEMRWRGGTVPLTGITTRSVTSESLARETSGASIRLTDLGIHAVGVTEVNMQHDDADITGSTTEVPGDSVLIAGPGRIVISACGVYLEARRLAPRAAPEATWKGL